MKMLSVRNPIFLLFVLGITAFSYSCEKTNSCEMDNTGTIIVENTHHSGRLQVHFNKSKVSVNGAGDLSIGPGEMESMDLPAGQHNVKAVLIISTCNNGRCSVSSSGKPEKNVDLAACEKKNLVY